MVSLTKLEALTGKQTTAQRGKQDMASDTQASPQAFLSSDRTRKDQKRKHMETYE